MNLEVSSEPNKCQKLNKKLTTMKKIDSEEDATFFACPRIEQWSWPMSVKFAETTNVEVFCENRGSLRRLHAASIGKKQYSDTLGSSVFCL